MALAATCTPKSKSQALHQCQTCAIILNAPAVQVTKCCRTLGGADFHSHHSLWLKILKLESEWCCDPWSPWGSAQLRSFQHRIIVSSSQDVRILQLDLRGLPYAIPQKSFRWRWQHEHMKHILERFKLSGAQVQYCPVFALGNQKTSCIQLCSWGRLINSQQPAAKFVPRMTWVVYRALYVDGEASLKARCTSSQVSQFLMHFDTAAGSSIDQTNWKITATTIDTGIKWPDLHVW